MERRLRTKFIQYNEKVIYIVINVGNINQNLNLIQIMIKVIGLEISKIAVVSIAKNCKILKEKN